MIGVGVAIGIGIESPLCTVDGRRAEKFNSDTDSDPDAEGNEDKDARDRADAPPIGFFSGIA